MFSTVPSKTWHRCRREPSAIDCQQGLASLQERTLCHWCPARPCIAAGENPLPLVPSTASKCCRGEPFLQWFPARPCTAAGEKVLSLVPRQTLNHCRRELVFNGPRQDLEPLQERHRCRWIPGRLGTASSKHAGYALIQQYVLHSSH